MLLNSCSVMIKINRWIYSIKMARRETTAPSFQSSLTLLYRRKFTDYISNMLQSSFLKIFSIKQCVINVNLDRTTFLKADLSLSTFIWDITEHDKVFSRCFVRISSTLASIANYLKNMGTVVQNIWKSNHCLLLITEEVSQVWVHFQTDIHLSLLL